MLFWQPVHVDLGAIVLLNAARFLEPITFFVQYGMTAGLVHCGQKFAANEILKNTVAPVDDYVTIIENNYPLAANRNRRRHVDGSGCRRRNKLGEAGFGQTVHQLTLHIAPYHAYGAIFAEGTTVGRMSAFIQHQRTIDGFNYLK